MPQLSPLNWLFSFSLILFFSATLISLFWWNQTLSFPLLSPTSKITKLVPTWKWL